MAADPRIPMRRIRWMGILSVITGSMYIPWLPWYALANVRESEIYLWGLLSISGGILAILSTFLLANRKRTLVQTALVISFFGMLLFFLAQLPPLYSWIPFQGKGIRFLLIIAHAAIAVLSLNSMVSIGMALASGQSPFRLSRKQGIATLTILLLGGLGWYGWHSYANANWVEVTTPMNGAKNVSLYAPVSAQWKPMDISNLGMRIQYADDPSIPILGMTSGSEDGVNFIPASFLPNKKVVVTVTAGYRTHSFSFTTAKEADERIDLYRAVLNYFFRDPQGGIPPSIVALDASSLEAWQEEEVKALARGLMPYAGGVVFGTPAEGFKPVDEKVPVPLEKNEEALLISIEQADEQFGVHEMVVSVKRGMDVLTGSAGSSFSIRYRAAFEDGKWNIQPLEKEHEKRPWG